MRFFELLSEVEAFYTTMYHGTDLNFLKSIKEKGLTTYKPLTNHGPGLQGIYLTPNISLAARYSAGGLSKGIIGRTQIILEIKIFKANRHNKMRVDPLDHPADSWSDEYDTSDSNDRDTLFEIQNDIENFIKRILTAYKIPFQHINTTIQAHELEEIRGFNLQQFILAHLEPYFKQNFYKVKNDINRAMVKEFAHQVWNDEVEITNNFTLRLTSIWWEKQHQTIYPKNLPFTTIKAVWVKKKDFPNVKGEEKKFGEEILPSEVRDEFLSKKHNLENIADELEKAIDYYDDDQNEDDFDNAVKEIKNSVENDDLLTMIDNIVKKIKDENKAYTPRKDLEELEDRARELSDYLRDDYSPYSSIENNKTTWVRVDVKSPEITKIIK